MHRWSLFRVSRFACFLASLAYASAAQANLVTSNYGDFSGQTRDYTAVIESSIFANPGPFGQPVIDAVNGNPDTLLFSNTNNFLSESLGPGAGANGLDSRLTFNVVAHDGFSIDTILFREKGVYSLSQSIDPTTDLLGLAQALVGNQIFYRITGVDGAMFAGSTIAAPDMTFSPTNVFTFNGVGSIVDAPWSGELLLDLASMHPELAGRITSVEIRLDNSVNTMNLPGGTATIRKDSLTITVPELPVGLFVSLGAACIVGLAYHRRRHSLASAV